MTSKQQNIKKILYNEISLHKRRPQNHFSCHTATQKQDPKWFKIAPKDKILKSIKTTKLRKQAGAELGQAQPQLGLRLANMEIQNWNEKLLKR